MKRIVVVLLATAPILAQRAPRTKKKAAVVAAEQTVVPVATGDTELAAMRAIQVRGRALYADLCRLVLLQRGEFNQYKTDAERCQRANELGFMNTKDVDIYKTPVSLGATTKTAIYAHNLERSLMFRLTGFSWYALQSAEALGLIEEGMNAGDYISGAELVQILDEAANLAEEKNNWNKTENPYRDFGYETYEDMYHNPSGPAKINPQGNKQGTP